jgi:hypothetical protein
VNRHKIFVCLSRENYHAKIIKKVQGRARSASSKDPLSTYLNPHKTADAYNIEIPCGPICSSIVGGWISLFLF